MVDDRLTVVIDTNILVSAIVFGGKPEKALKQATSHRIGAVTSLVLLAELSGVLTKKFNYTDRRVLAIEEKLKQSFETVVPSREVKVLNSADDRVLETALTGRCRYIITGDAELLALGNLEGTKIVNLNEFLEISSRF